MEGVEKMESVVREEEGKMKVSYGTRSVSTLFQSLRRCMPYYKQDENR